MNTNELQKYLQKIGLSKNESEFYLSAIQFPIFNLTQIAKASGLKRTTCYSIADTLLAKGYIVSVPDSKMATYIPIQPRVVLDRLTASVHAFSAIMPQLEALVSTDRSADIRVEFYRGTSGIREVMSMILRDKPKELIGYSSAGSVERYLGKKFIDDWNVARAKSGIIRRSLATDIEREIQIRTNPEHKRIIKNFPPSVNFEGTLNLWADKVWFISNKDENISFVVYSQVFSDFIRANFEFLWKTLQ